MAAIWADVYSSAGDRLGAGPVSGLLTASVTRVLDGVGSVRLDALGTDERALSLLTNERRVRLYLEERGVTRELGRGIIRSVGAKDSPASWTLSADGPDDLDELKRRSVLLGRKFDDTAVAFVASGLIGLVPGWSVVTDLGLGSVSARYDGVSVFKALLLLVEQQDLHLRAGSSPNILEIGAFGNASGVRIMSAQSAGEDFYTNPNVLLIERMTLEQDSEAVCNWLIPLGAGEADAAITLERSTRSVSGGDPYDVQSATGPDGRTLYYLADSASITAYGEIQKVGTFKNVAPLSNSDTDLENAANALYDAAASWLRRNSVRQDTYSFTVRNVQQTLRPGDTVHVRYKGLIYREGVAVTYRDINDDFYLMKITERVGAEGVALDLTVSSIDRALGHAAQIILGAIEAIEIRNVAVQPYFNKTAFVWEREVDNTHPATVPIDITNATQRISRVLLRVTTRPFRATAKSAAAGGATAVTSASGGSSSVTSAGGGSHRHRFAVFNSSSPWAVSNHGFLVGGAAGGQNINIEAPEVDLYTHETVNDHTHQVSIPAHSHQVNLPDHTHSLTFGIQDATTYPVNIRIAINGTDRTSELGGPWGASNSAVDEELDITEWIAAGSLQQRHTVRFTCDSGQGEVEATVELYEIIQSIAVL